MSSPVAELPRLRLRGWEEGDVARFATALNTPAVTRHLGGLQPVAEIEATIARLRGFERSHGFTFWAVERRDDDAFLGFCGLKPLRPDLTPPSLHDRIEIGWRLREDAWGQGYAREAAEGALALGFERFGLASILAMTVPANRPSWGLMRRLGMTPRPELDFDMPGHGRHIIYELEKTEWMASRSSSSTASGRASTTAPSSRPDAG